MNSHPQGFMETEVLVSSNKERLVKYTPAYAILLADINSCLFSNEDPRSKNNLSYRPKQNETINNQSNSTIFQNGFVVSRTNCLVTSETGNGGTTKTYIHNKRRNISMRIQERLSSLQEKTRNVDSCDK